MSHQLRDYLVLQHKVFLRLCTRPLYSIDERLNIVLDQICKRLEITTGPSSPGKWRVSWDESFLELSNFVPAVVYDPVQGSPEFYQVKVPDVRRTRSESRHPNPLSYYNMWYFYDYRTLWPIFARPGFKVLESWIFCELVRFRNFDQIHETKVRVGRRSKYPTRMHLSSYFADAAWQSSYHVSRDIILLTVYDYRILYPTWVYVVRVVKLLRSLHRDDSRCLA